LKFRLDVIPMTVEAALGLVQSKTLASLVKDEIIGMIRDGELTSGAKLVEVWFTERFGVSRAAVREAFRGLEEAGLARLEKNRGVFVRQFSKSEAIELYELRACLEEMAARRLAGLITDAQLSALLLVNTRLGGFAKKQAINQYYPLNIAFHDRLIDITEHSALQITYRRVIDQMHLLRRRGYEFNDGLEKSHQEHADILEALTRRDADAAALAMRKHATNGMARYLQT
jgi:DNA-binding GntR family transcriptional regulator